MTMNSTLKGAAKRLTFSLILLSALGGCAVYGPPPGPYAYGTDANGQPLYTTPPVYPAPYYPYYYDPLYLGAPLFFGFGANYWGGRGGYRGGRGGGRGGGHGGGRGGGHR